MKNKKGLVVGVSALVLGMFSAPSMAEGMSVEDMYTKCGIGGAIFTEKPTFAAISNVIWDSGTTAVTSGLSESGCEGAGAQSAALIYKSYAALETETAEGKGEHLAALMDIYKCDISSRETVINGVRADLATQMQDSAYSSANHLEKVKAYHGSVSNNVASSCNVI